MQVDPTSGPAGSGAVVSSITGCPDTDGVFSDVTAYVGDQPNLLTGASLGSESLGSAGGAWSIPITIPADAEGTVTLYAQCIGTPNNSISEGESAQAAPGDVVLSTYTPVTFSVVAPPTTTTTSTSTSTTSTTSSSTTTTTAAATTTTTTPPSVTAVPNFMYPGESCLITAHGFKPGTDVTITVFSDPLVIGTFAADANGTISQTWTVPSGFAAGAHTVSLTGQTIAGAVELTVPITVGSLVQVVTTTAVTPTATTTPAAITTTGNLPTTGSGLTQPLVLGSVVLVLGGGTALVVSRKRARSDR
jgi:hypothetical protein